MISAAAFITGGPIVKMILDTPYTFMRGPAALDEFARSVGCESQDKTNEFGGIDTKVNVNTTLSCNGLSWDDFAWQAGKLTGERVGAGYNVFHAGTCEIYFNSRSIQHTNGIYVESSCSVPIWTVLDLLPTLYRNL